MTQKLAFVIMAMAKEHPELEDILNTIKEACKDFGVDAARVDDIEHSGRITDLILQSIRAADVVIADLSYERPNVYYELGYAHGLDQRVILTAKEGTVLHFDIKDYNVIFYRNMTVLREKLIHRLRSILDRKSTVKEVVTVCTKCRHFLDKTPGSDLWYKQYCMASPLPKKVDPYDGELRSFETNSYGEQLFTDEKYSYCRDINDGSCKLYEENRATS